MSNPRRVLGYCRVSTQVQGDEGTSLDRQRESIERYCREHGLPAPEVRVEIESGAAHREEAREEQRRTLDDLRPGDVVVVAAQDRWSRDTVHFLRSVDEITRKGGRFFALAERFDPSTPEGRFVSTIMAAVAEQERARIRDRTLGARQRLRAQGAWVEGQAPLGYRVEGRRLVPSEPGATVVRRLFELAAAGRTTRQIALELQAWWPDVPGLDFSNVAVRIRDRRYLGELQAEGGRGKTARASRWLPGTHEPLVSPELFAAANRGADERRTAGRVPGEATANHLLRGIVRCGVCSRRCAAQPAIAGRSGGGWYLCPDSACAGRTHARRDHVDAELEALVLARLVELGRELSAPVRAPAPAGEDFAAARAELATRRARLVRAVEAGTLEPEDVRARLDALGAALAELDARERAARPVTHETRAADLATASGLRHAWERATVDERRRIVRLLVAGVTLQRREGARRWERGAWTLAETWQ